MLLKWVSRASLRSRSEKSRQVAIDRSRTIGCSILLNQPTNRVSEPPGNAVGQKEVEVFLLCKAGDDGSDCHGSVKLPG